MKDGKGEGGEEEQSGEEERRARIGSKKNGEEGVKDTELWDKEEQEGRGAETGRGEAGQRREELSRRGGKRLWGRAQGRQGVVRREEGGGGGRGGDG